MTKAESVMPPPTTSRVRGCFRTYLSSRGGGGNISRNLGEKCSGFLRETVGAGNILQFHALSGQTKRGFYVPPSVCCFDSAWSEKEEKGRRDGASVGAIAS